MVQLIHANSVMRRTHKFVMPGGKRRAHHSFALQALVSPHVCEPTGLTHALRLFLLFCWGAVLLAVVDGDSLDEGLLL